ncbi:hypothetical protein J5X98_17270 [Leptothermofonsia sichuanensis E412]|jgi:hypothetical protein|uniref:hypothetical protein n=1 Tax=Leptothermofonsia sichuanensis TaxID=2917832 RepID=UPI001CA6887C|nr:hypothetical protein [Leptothermofonsia sichuanensis]QZZ19155.1 hypothetical protein J5X98_17270 [Leptothermofonsia sichuanensis E412]
MLKPEDLSRLKALMAEEQKYMEDGDTEAVERVKVKIEALKQAWREREKVD